MLGDAADHVADSLIDECGSLGAVIGAGPSLIDRIAPDHPGLAEFVTDLHKAFLQALRTDLTDGPVLAGSGALMDYLFVRMAHAPAEQFRVLFLNAAARLLRDEAMGRGSVSEAPIYPREVIRRALELGATALIIVHNHPSGDPNPSRQDIAITREITLAAGFFGINIFDHVIVSKRGCVSFRERGLL